jgi:MFS family permease
MATGLSATLAEIRRAVGLTEVRQVVQLSILLLLFGWSARILFQPLALDLGLSSRVTGWMYAAFAAATVLGGLAAGHLASLHARTALIGAFALVLAALTATSQLAWLAPFVFLPVMGFGYAMGMTVLEVRTNEVAPRSVRAAIFGVITCIAGIGIAVARPTVGLLSDTYSPAFAAGLWAGVGVLLVGLAALVIRRLPKQRSDLLPAATSPR